MDAVENRSVASLNVFRYGIV
eukprot:SAG31_NODE_42761_length_270_cov_0.602339_1_plen_20_part_01